MHPLWIYPNNRLYTGRLIVLSLPAGFAMIFATIMFAAGLNLVADPSVTIQVGTETHSAHARTADPDEKPRLWQLMVDAMPSYADYAQATTRDIPVVLVELPGRLAPP